MQHSRQVLLSKTSLVRIQHAEQTGTEKEQELVKLRFKDLEYSEVTFKSIKSNPKNPTRFTGVIELTHRDGFEFTQTWTAADTVSFFKTAQHVELATVESFKDIIKPGLYFVKDVAEMVVLLRDEMGLEEVLSLLGYGFESGEVELIERHVQLKSPMTIGTLPVRRIFKKEDGTYSDGTRLEVTLSETNDVVVAGNPDFHPTLTVKYLPKKKPTVLKEGGVVLKEGSKLVTVTMMGVDKPIITGELVNGSFSTPLDLTGLVGEDISFLVTVGLADDVRTQEYSVQYVAENWSFQPITEPKYTRVGYPLELTGLVTSDLGNEPWGGFKTTITQPDGSTEVQELAPTGVVSVTTTPLIDGELNIDFKCGEGDNTVNVNYQIQPPVALGELAFSDVVVASSILNPEQLLELSGELKAFDGTTRTDAEVKVLFDDQEQKTIHPDIEGNLVATLPVANDDLDDKVIDVTLKHLELETAPIKVTIKPSAQVPHRFEVLNNSGYMGTPSELKFLIYDTKNRMVIGAEVTYQIGDGDVRPLVSQDEEYIIDMGDGVGETFNKSVKLTCQGLTDAVSWEWKIHEVVMPPLDVEPDDGEFVPNVPYAWSGTVTSPTGLVLDGLQVRLIDNGVLLATAPLVGGGYNGSFTPDEVKTYKLTAELSANGITYVTDVVNLEVTEGEVIEPTYELHYVVVGNPADIGGELYAEGTLTSNGGNVSNQTLDIYSGGNKVMTVDTDEEGKFRFDLQTEEPGAYSIGFGFGALVGEEIDVVVGGTQLEALSSFNFVDEVPANHPLNKPLELVLTALNQNGDAFTSGNDHVVVNSEDTSSEFDIEPTGRVVVTIVPKGKVGENTFTVTSKKSGEAIGEITVNFTADPTNATMVLAPWSTKELNKGQPASIVVQVNDQNDLPLSGVQVWGTLDGKGELVQMAETNEHGLATFTQIHHNLDQTTASFVVLGNTVLTHHFTWSDKTLPTKVSLDLKDWVFSEGTEVLVTGHVADSNNTPMEGEIVTLYNGETLEVLGQALSENNGLFSIELTGPFPATKVGVVAATESGIDQGTLEYFYNPS